MNASFLAHAYHDGQSEYRRSAHAFTSLYARQAWDLAHVRPGASVLDIACGTGSLAFIAAAQGARVLAIDYSPGMVDAVNAAAKPGVEASVMDGQALDLSDGEFDAVFSLFGIMLFPDWRRGLSEMARVVRPGGTGCVASWHHPGGAALNMLLAEYLGAHFPYHPASAGTGGMDHFADPDRFARAMQAAGFVDVGVHEITNDYVVNDRVMADLEGTMAFNPLWRSCDERQHAEFTAMLVERRDAANGRLLLPSPALIALGVRL